MQEPAVSVRIAEGGVGDPRPCSWISPTSTPRSISSARAAFMSETTRCRACTEDGAELQPWPEPQRYTRLETGDGGGLYRFLSLDGGFTADLPVDLDGLVLDYPGLFRRVFP